MKSPHRLPPGNVAYVARVLLYRLGADRVTDLAGAMTFYLLLSVFPLLLAAVSTVSLLGGADWLVPRLATVVTALAGGATGQAFSDIASGFLASEGAGWTLAISLVAAIWSASSYIGAFAWAVNAVYQVREGRPFLKLKAIQLAMTLALVLLIVILGVGLAVTETAARWLGGLVHRGDEFAAVWSWAHYPLIAVVVVIIVQMLYFAAPNVRQPRVRALSIGSLVAIGLSVGVALLFRVYLSVFNGASAYTKTYGALAGVVIALFVAYLVNIALLLGAELDAALERLHQLSLGLPAESGLLLPARDDRALESGATTRADLVRRGHAIRQQALAAGVVAPEWYVAERLEADRDQSLETAPRPTPQ